jgi:hypothetical protein
MLSRFGCSATTPTRRRRTVGTAVATVVACLAIVGTAAAGQYDYTMWGDPSGNVTRGALHDYSYLHGTLSGFTTCVQRTLNGTSFCAANSSAHSYGDPCNPASCASFYGFHSSNALQRIITVHEEWRD